MRSARPLIAAFGLSVALAACTFVTTTAGPPPGTDGIDASVGNDAASQPNEPNEEPQQAASDGGEAQDVLVLQDALFDVGSFDGSVDYDASRDGEAAAGRCSKVNPTTGIASCDACLTVNCTSEVKACFDDTSARGCECQAVYTCVQACTSMASGSPCTTKCVADHNANGGGAAFVDFGDCLVNSCGRTDGGADGPCASLVN